MNSLALAMLVALALWGFLEAAPTGASTGGATNATGVCEELVVNTAFTDLWCSFNVTEITNSSLQALHLMHWNATDGRQTYMDASYECQPLTLTTRRNGTFVLAYIPVRSTYSVGVSIQ